MALKTKFLLHSSFLIINFLIGATIISYFWQMFDIETSNVHPLIMVLALIYVIIELVKKYVHIVLTTWNKLYYIGLFAVVSPTALLDKIDLNIIVSIVKYGSFFLLIPIIIETVLVKAYYKNQQKEQ